MHDAEIISVGRATIEMRVGKPPSTRDEALELAREQFVYCPDSVDQGAGSVPSLAAELLNGRVWHFWWIDSPPYLVNSGLYLSRRLVARNISIHWNPVPEPQYEQYEEPSLISLPHCLQYISVLL